MRLSLSTLRSNTWGPLALMCASLAAVMLGFSLLAHASLAAAAPVATAATDPGGLLGMLLTGHYLPAVGGVLVIGVGLARSQGAKLWPWLGTKLGGYVLAYVAAYALYLGTAWQAGSPWDTRLFLTAFSAALGASGVLDHWRDIVNALTSGSTMASKTSAAATLIMVILGCCGIAALGGACANPKVKAVEHALWDCTAPERADAVAAVTPAVVSVIKAAGSADGKMIDTSTVKAAITKANLLSEAGVLLSCALASAVATLMAPTPAPAAGAPASSPYVIAPAAVAKMWFEINATQLGGAHFAVAGGQVL